LVRSCFYFERFGPEFGKIKVPFGRPAKLGSIHLPGVARTIRKLK